jgi:DNA-directed RNA polymerase specialized sigma24 family protein
MSKNVYIGIDQKIISSVKYYARKLKSNTCFERYEIEDLEQDLMIFVLSKLNQFDARKSQVGTFVSGILRNHTSNLIRNRNLQKSDKPRVFYETDLQNIESENLCESIISAADINSFVSKNLPKYLQKTFEILKTNDVKTTAKLLNKSISAIYLRIRKIRELMSEFSKKETMNENNKAN